MPKFASLDHFIIDLSGDLPDSEELSKQDISANIRAALSTVKRREIVDIRLT
jgi:hypothetical protein